MNAFITTDSIVQAEMLLQAMREGDDQGARMALSALADARESMLFKEIGTITRDLHDAIRQFSDDNRLTQLTAEGMPDARERLRYVTTLTEQAANRTLGAAEQALPLTDNLIRRSSRVAERLGTLKELHPGNQVLLDAFGPIETYLASVNKEGEQVRGHINEIIMAQEFQDLTGQLMSRVIQMLEHLETEMVRLVRLVGMSSSQVAGASPDDATRAEGPALPTAGVNVMHSQDDVDDLLASLGF